MENKRLLERAIAVQGRVIGVVARAATAGDGAGRLWTGAWAPAGPMALSARA